MVMIMRSMFSRRNVIEGNYFSGKQLSLFKKHRDGGDNEIDVISKKCHLRGSNIFRRNCFGFRFDLVFSKMSIAFVRANHQH